MTRFIVVAMLFSIAMLFTYGGKGCTAHAGEYQFLGKITVSDGSSKNNVTAATPFKPGPATSKFAVQCPDAGAWVCESQGVCNIGQGTLMPAGAQKCTSIDILATDAGLFTGLVSIRPVAGSNDAECIFTKSTCQ